MSMVRTSLGVDPGLEHTDFIFGDDTEVVRVRFRLAGNLHQPESIAQQNLDFIRKLYLEQPFPGEYFEQIHLATEFGCAPDSPSKPVSTEPDLVLENEAEEELQQDSETPARHTILRDALDQLFEHLLQWINTESIPLKLVCHDGIDVTWQKQVLSLHKPLAEFSIHNTKNVSNAMALWSFAFAGRSQPVKPSESIGEAVHYEVLSEHFTDQYLPVYKQQLVKKFENMTFPNADIEDERHILINLAKEPDSTKYELMNYQERISGMLEKHMHRVATTTENPQRNVLEKTLPKSLGSGTDIGLFDMEAIDNAGRIWNEINQTIKRNRKPESNSETAFEPVALFEEAALETRDEPPMFELEARAVKTGFRPQRSKGSQKNKIQKNKTQKDKIQKNKTQKDKTQKNKTQKDTTQKRKRSQNHTLSANVQSDNVPDVASDHPANLAENVVDYGQNTETPASTTGEKHNDFFSSPAFALQNHSGSPDNEEFDTVAPTKNSLIRNESRYLPLLAIVAVAGIYYLIR